MAEGAQPKIAGCAERRAGDDPRPTAVRDAHGSGVVLLPHPASRDVHGMLARCGSVCMRREQTASECDQRALQVIVEQTERLSRLIAVLLDRSRIESGH